MSHTNRIVLLIDMDCFYCQVEENLDPSLKGKPVAVVQYNQWRGGGIIAVNYPARDKGVTRHMRGNDAKKQCPEIALVKVPEVRGKADLSKYREAGKRVANVLQMFTPNLERASVDEAYLDITDVVEKRLQDGNDQISAEKLPNSFVVGHNTLDFIENVTLNRTYDECNFKLALGAIIAEEIRAEVFKITGYKCSAGIAHNKILAKLVCGLHKPNKQTILPHESVTQLYEKTPINKLTGLGGKFGNNIMKKLHIEFMNELSKFTQKELVKKFDEKSGSWLYNLAKGIDTEPVNTRLISKSIGCCKKFPGKSALCQIEDIKHWLSELSEEIAERLEKDLSENSRRAKQMVVSFAHETGDGEINGTKTHPLTSYDQNRILNNALKIVQKNCLKDNGYRVTFLGISVGNFQDVRNIKEITSFFKNTRKTVKEANVETKNDEDKDDLSGTSIYSRTTEEGDFDVENIVYYQQICPESIENQNFIFDDIEEGPNSICQEIDQDNVNVAPTASFFSKYFNNNIDRNLNASETIENTIDDSKSQISPSINICNEEARIKINETQQNITVDDNACPECGKIILDSTEYQSHLDYHFAISIVKNEAHLYKSENKPSSSPIKNGSKKRKKDFANSCHKPIGDYFKSSINEEIQEKDVCKECNKRVALSEWDVHTDYHAAKKLHLEMNVNKKNNIDKSAPLGKKLVKSQKNITGFFKPS